MQRQDFSSNCQKFPSDALTTDLNVRLVTLSSPLCTDLLLLCLGGLSEQPPLHLHGAPQAARPQPSLRVTRLILIILVTDDVHHPEDVSETKKL